MRTKHAKIDVECLFVPNTEKPLQLISRHDNYDKIEDDSSYTLEGGVSWQGIFPALHEKIALERKLNKTNRNSIKLWWRSPEYGFFVINDDETLTTAVLLTNNLSFQSPLSVTIYAKISEESDLHEYRLESIYL